MATKVSSNTKVTEIEKKNWHHRFYCFQDVATIVLLLLLLLLLLLNLIRIYFDEKMEETANRFAIKNQVDDLDIADKNSQKMKKKSDVWIKLFLW